MDRGAADADAAGGWQARLDLEFECRRGGTVLSGRRHHGPLLVQRSFHPEGEGPCHVYLIHPPGGIAGGDSLTLQARLNPGSHALLTTPAAGKCYRSGETRGANVTQRFSVDDAILEWLPQENIYYPGARMNLRNIVKLESTARFIGWEMACLGLPANSRTLEDGSLRLHFELWHEARPLLVERLALGGDALSARWGLAGFNSLGTAVFYPASIEALNLARAALPPNCAQMMFACTLVDDVLICRAMAQRADRMRHAFVRLWQALRPPLLGRGAVLPRIWNT